MIGSHMLYSSTETKHSQIKMKFRQAENVWSVYCFVEKRIMLKMAKGWRGRTKSVIRETEIAVDTNSINTSFRPLPNGQSLWVRAWILRFVKYDFVSSVSDG